MTGDGARVWWRRRFALALTIVAAIVVVAPASNAIFTVAGTASGAVPANAALRASDLIAGGDVDEALSNIEQAAEPDAASVEGLPDEYAEEIGFVTGARDVRVSGSIVGFVVDGACDDAYKKLCSHMELRGWAVVPAGGITGATFVKESGRYTWVFATCTQVGNATSVVLRLA